MESFTLNKMNDAQQKAYDATINAFSDAVKNLSQEEYLEVIQEVLSHMESVEACVKEELEGEEEEP